MTKPQKTGRPTKYKEEYAQLAYEFALLGATDKEMAESFGVNEDTLHEWRKKHPDFSESTSRGKTIADAKIGLRLFQKATGYNFPTETNIQIVEGKVVKTEIIRHLPPDTTAIMFWLKNRRRDSWTDKPLPTDELPNKIYDLSKLSDEELRTLLKLQAKAGVI